MHSINGISIWNHYTREVIKEIDSITSCILPKRKNRTEEYKMYEGEYASPGRKNMIIQVKENHLRFKWTGAELFSTYILYRNGEDYFSFQPLTVLFVKNNEGKVEKAWCQNRGKASGCQKINNIDLQSKYNGEFKSSFYFDRDDMS